MMTRERVRELRTIYEATKDAPESRIDLDAWDVIETMEALYRVIEAAKIVDAQAFFNADESSEILEMRDALEAFRAEEKKP